MGELRKLQEAAASATAAGDWLRASGCYASLEKADPTDGTWPLRLGECQRKLGRAGEAVKALTRALKAYSLANMHQKAAAVCRLILEIEPHNRQIPPILAALNAPAERSGEPDANGVPDARSWRDSSVFNVPATVRRAERAQRRESTPTPRPQPDGVVIAASPPAPATPAPLTPSPGPGRPLPRVVLPRTPFFSAMSEQQLRTVNARARLLEVETGQILFAAGDPAEDLYLLAAGRLAVLAPNEVMRLMRGDFFGEEVVVLPGQDRLATLRAVEPSQVLALDRPLMEELVAETPALLEILAQGLRDRLLDLFIQSSPMLASLPLRERGVLMSTFDVFTAEAGDCVLDGETPALCAVLAGRVELSLERQTIDTLQPGDVFGETAWVSTAPAATAAIARERCFLLYLGGGDLPKLRSGYPDVIAYLAALAENRLERLRQSLAPPVAAVAPTASLPRVLIAHHDTPLQSYTEAFRAGQFLVESTSDPEVAMRIIAERRFDVVVCGTEWLAEVVFAPLGEIRRRDLDVPIILTTRDTQLDTAGAAASYGVVRTFVEPVAGDELVDAAARAVRFHRLARMQREARLCLGSSGEWMGDRAGLELHFGNALDGLWMAFQPIVSASARDVFAFEALLRSREEILSSPVAVLRAAERLRRVHDVGRLARDSVAATAAGAAHPPLIFVNVHHQDLLDQHLLDPQARLSAIASGVILEITERKPLDELADLRARIAALRALGYRFAIDNLGSGHAGVATLAQLEPDIAKLDISLIRGVDHEPLKQGLVAAMLQSCREMGIQAICEGVETAAERDWLLHAGADLMQGYLFAKPGPPFPAVDLHTLPGPTAAGK